MAFSSLYLVQTFLKNKYCWFEDKSKRLLVERRLATDEHCRCGSSSGRGVWFVRRQFSFSRVIMASFVLLFRGKITLMKLSCPSWTKNKYFDSHKCSKQLWQAPPSHPGGDKSFHHLYLKLIWYETLYWLQKFRIIFLRVKKYLKYTQTETFLTFQARNELVNCKLFRKFSQNS